MAAADIEFEEAEDEVPGIEEHSHAEDSRDAGVRVRPLRILMAAGGTGGHIFPALAVAGELQLRGQEGQGRPTILFLGTTRGLESRLIPAAGFELRTVAAAGLKGIGGWKRLVNLAVLPRSAFGAASILKEFRPDVVVGVGGYLAGPVMLEAALMNIPTLLMEPNAVPGLTNRLLAPVVRAAAVGFEEAARFYGSKARVTGHAVRKEFFEIAPKVHHAPFTLLVVGGSQGARAINECFMKTLKLLSRAPWPLNVVHQTGERDYNTVQGMYRDQGLNAEVGAFIDDMPGAFARADLMISRAGATAVAELTAAGKASILVPFPGATDQHQLENARALERAGAACLMEQSAMTPERLAAQVLDLLGDPTRLVNMEQRAKKLARPDATRRIADWVIELGSRRAAA